MNTMPCLICKKSLDVRVAHSRKAKKPKPFIMLVCPVDARHFRAFITDQTYVAQVLARLEKRP